jgi:hypothetical protein
MNEPSVRQVEQKKNWTLTPHAFEGRGAGITSLKDLEGKTLVRRLGNAGFTPAQAELISELHTPNFM